MSKKRIKGYDKKTRRKLVKDSKKDTRRKLIEQKIFKIGAFLLMVLGILSLFLSYEYFGNTFIRFEYLIVVFVISYLLNTRLNRIWYKYTSFKVDIHWINISSALIISFLCLLSNTIDWSGSKSKQEIFVIQEVGESFLYTKSKSCKEPFVEVIHDGLRKRIYLDCSSRSKYINSSQILLELQEGFLGFDIILNKKLIK